MNDTTLRRLANTDLHVSALSFGGNVFGWTADEPTSFALLDAYRAAGGNFVDSADSYSAWVEGHTGGESEEILGRWTASRKHDDMIIATKVAQHPEFPGLSAANVKAAAEASLRRLGVDTIDLYYAHAPDAKTPIAESAAAFSSLVDEGKVRYVGLSKHGPDQIREWLAACDEGGLHRPVCLQEQYNLVERGVENDLVPFAQKEGLALLPFFGLARGFLTGKYRPGNAEASSPRAAGARSYLDDPRGERVLAALDAIATERSTEPSTVALAWLLARPGVVSVLSSARNSEQLKGLLALNELRLTVEEIDLLDEASA